MWRIYYTLFKQMDNGNSKGKQMDGGNSKGKQMDDDNIKGKQVVEFLF